MGTGRAFYHQNCKILKTDEFCHRKKYGYLMDNNG